MKLLLILASIYTGADLGVGLLELQPLTHSAPPSVYALQCSSTTEGGADSMSTGVAKQSTVVLATRMYTKIPHRTVLLNS